MQKRMYIIPNRALTRVNQSQGIKELILEQKNDKNREIFLESHL